MQFVSKTVPLLLMATQHQVEALQHKTYDLTTKLGNLDGQCQEDYRDWLFAVTCKDKILDLTFPEENTTLQSDELLVVDIESILKKD